MTIPYHTIMTRKFWNLLFQQNIKRYKYFIVLEYGPKNDLVNKVGEFYRKHQSFTLKL